MKVFNWVLLVGLSLNVIATGIDLQSINPDWIDWANLVGCIIFGAHLRDMTEGKSV